MTSPNNANPAGKIAVFGISWFHAADYTAALAIMTDAVLPHTYANWLQKARRSERELQDLGHKTVRAIVDPNTFPGWCARNGFTKIDAKARTAFAAEYAARHIGL